MKTNRKNALKLGAAAAVAAIIPATALAVPASALAASPDITPRLRALILGIRNLSGDTISMAYEQCQELADQIEDILGDPRSASSLGRLSFEHVKGVVRDFKTNGQLYEFYLMDVTGGVS